MEQNYFYTRYFVSQPNKDIKMTFYEFIYAEIRESHVFAVTSDILAENRMNYGE